MNLILDNRTQTVVQVAVSLMLCVLMAIAWQTQKTYPGFGRWTVSKIPNALGWLLISLRGVIPDWASVLVANGLLLIAPILLYEGIGQFREKPYRSIFHYLLMALVLGGFVYFTWVQPNVNARVVMIAAYSALIIGRCALSLWRGVTKELRPSFWFTAVMFGLYDIVLLLRVATSVSLPTLLNPFTADMWQQLVFLATIIMPIGWTFGFLMMTNNRLTLELRKAEIEMREMAATDFLTGALNRRSFIELSQHEHERARRNGMSMMLLVIDIDHFKEFNDKYGHFGGDEMLRALVATFRANMRASDSLARWGGDEFAILLPDTDQAGGLNVAEKLRCSVAELDLVVNHEHSCATVSVGGALWMAEEKDLEPVLRRADSALYQAKAGGRNRVVSSSSN